MDKEQLAPVMIIAALGGLAAFLKRWSQGGMRHPWRTLVAGVSIAAIAGVVVLNLGQALGLNDHLIAALSGICGYMGPRFFELGERLVNTKVSR